LLRRRQELRTQPTRRFTDETPLKHTPDMLARPDRMPRCIYRSASQDAVGTPRTLL